MLSKQAGLGYRWLNLKSAILPLPGTFGDCSFHTNFLAVSALEGVGVL